ncbi:maleylpyruvate isomerase family mycothiol-dependent enzyme [Streptomyces sp. NRRL S-87]|uniref:maleylpyruvate isomerase family mycothiol-dependent enzyme n=1 Tax=Streptomyces sp. NRRL S-87 TaxID=1463920 RepID=UPI0004C211F9|nr:maleylpyruvate isomerase family mycothiol-dependent enzyme [Streptomyces sp. NRRL S-87]
MDTVGQLDHRAAVAAETRRFADVIEGADLAAAVPDCPGWTLLDLTRHVGSVQRWFSVLLRQRVQERPTSRDVDLQLPADESGYVAWLGSGAEVAAEAFAATDLDAPMWVWGADAHARFWARRMCFETLLHRVDAERAVGLPSVLDPALAHDGVDEFLVNLPFATPFAPKVAHLRGTGRTIRFQHAEPGGAGGAWVVELRPDGFGLVGAADARSGAPATEAAAAAGAAPELPAADATVRAATAGDLLLLLYGRLDHTAGTVTTGGDTALLDLWFANSEF